MTLVARLVAQEHDPRSAMTIHRAHETHQTLRCNSSFRSNHSIAIGRQSVRLRWAMGSSLCPSQLELVAPLCIQLIPNGTTDRWVNALEQILVGMCNVDLSYEVQHAHNQAQPTQKI